MITLTSLGGAGGVTGSKHLLESDGHRILVDCGLFQGLKKLREQNWDPLPIKPSSIDAVILTHTRPEPMLGLLRRLDGGPERTRALGYLSRGGTLDTAGLLFANRCTWAHAVAAAAELIGIGRDELLTLEEAAAVAGKAHPRILQAA